MLGPRARGTWFHDALGGVSYGVIHSFLENLSILITDLIVLAGGIVEGTHLRSPDRDVAQYHSLLISEPVE